VKQNVRIGSPRPDGRDPLDQHALDFYRIVFHRQFAGAVQFRRVVRKKLDQDLALLDPLALLLEDQHAGALVAGRPAGLGNGHNRFVGDGVYVAGLHRRDVGGELARIQVVGLQIGPAALSYDNL